MEFIKKEKHYREADREIRFLYNKLKSQIEEAKTTDVEINEDGKCFVEDLKGEKREIKCPLSGNEILLLGGYLASNNDKKLNSENPIFDTQVLYDDARLNITIPMVTTAPTLSLRFHHLVYRDLEKLVENEMLTKQQAKKLRDYVLDKRNIIISGETGSGKSTLLNALANEIPNTERVIVIEDTRELLIDKVKNIVYLTTSATTDSIKCVQACLRKNPDRIIYGEVRGGEALSLIESWNTAHRGGLATIHANSANAVFIRMKTLCGYNSLMDQSEMIREALDVVVQLGFANGKRKVVEIKVSKNE